MNTFWRDKLEIRTSMCINKLQPKTWKGVLLWISAICCVGIGIGLALIYHLREEVGNSEDFRLWTAINTVLYDCIQNAGRDDECCCGLLFEVAPLAKSVYDGSSNTLKSIRGNLNFGRDTIKVFEEIMYMEDNSLLNSISVYSSSLKQITEQYKTYEVIYHIDFKDFDEYALCEILKNKKRKGEDEIILVNTSVYLTDLISEKRNAINSDYCIGRLNIENY